MIYAKDCLEKFGEPNMEFESKWMTLLVNDIGGVVPKKIYCNKLMAPKLLQALQELKSAGLITLIKTWDGCFNVRKSRTSNSYSLHAWGLAIDINASANPLGKFPTMDKRIVTVFKKNGFEWGGDWKLYDGMHYQLSTL